MNPENSQSITKPDDVVIEDGASLDDMKMSVKTIEGLFHAINNATFPLKWYTEAMTGMAFLKAIYDGIIKKLGPAEVEKIRQTEAFKATAQTAESSGKAN